MEEEKQKEDNKNEEYLIATSKKRTTKKTKTKKKLVVGLLQKGMAAVSKGNIFGFKLAEVTVIVPPPDNTRGRDFNVEMKKKHFKIGLKSSSPSSSSHLSMLH